MSNVLQNSQDPQQDMVVSYLTIRKAVGYLGLTFPIILALGTWLIGRCPCLEDSVSSYYYTVMGSYFVGALCSVGLFLFSYKGYNTIDQILSRVASVFILAVAFVPTNSISPCLSCNIYTEAPNTFRDTAHFVTSAIFFAIMAYMSIFLFTKTDQGQRPTKQKLQRNKVYKVCGYLMIIFLLLIPALKIKGVPASFFNYRPEFWFEAVVLGAFGFSWLTKGEAILKDE
jgi:putative Mn2+ efflux pump MntP